MDDLIVPTCPVCFEEVALCECSYENEEDYEDFTNSSLDDYGL